MARRLTIVVELNNPAELGVSFSAERTAEGVLDGDVSHQLVAAQWGEQVGPADTSTTAFVTARPGWDHCAHCHAEGRPCWTHAQ